MNLKPGFYNPNECSLWYGLDTSMTFSLFRQTHDKGKLEMFLNDLNSFNDNIKFTHESSKENVTFLHLIVKLSKGHLTTDLYIKDTD